jgi:hypothetical protein
LSSTAHRPFHKPRREGEREKNRRSTRGLREMGAADCDPQIASGLLYEQQRRIGKYGIMN